MAFCTKCGKKLEEGEVCNCTQMKPENNNHINLAISPATENILKSLWESLVGMLVKPISTIQKFIEQGDDKESLILIVLRALLLAILTTTVFSKLGKIMDRLSGLFEKVFDYSTDSDTSISDILQFDMTKIFITTVILSVIISMVYALILFCVSKIGGAKMADFHKMMHVTALGLCGDIWFYAIALIATFINLGVALFCIGIGKLFTLIYTYKAYETASDMEKDKMILGVIVSTVIIIIVTYVTIKLAHSAYLPDFKAMGLLKNMF